MRHEMNQIAGIPLIAPVDLHQFAKEPFKNQGFGPTCLLPGTEVPIHIRSTQAKPAQLRARCGQENTPAIRSQS